ncbi:hypothetical protein NEOLEDRAFT_1098260 [Neolentinus lepideus HHB14362 ss-1]|uniref:Autophagy-related protein 14 n=1 Tax=Neolentinus lepideus HHB14362 ss-1 TaxID=1314782 RepID=A0A165Q9P5_9AGAM|nr:hypothetical protein NEOLEDRAFT_1098260 [Neolentinus lepideus HHB14362 ss-1]
MGQSSRDELVDRDGTDEILMFRRLRNVTAVQVRNLTPFPVRDSFATAMTQPSEQSQFTTHGRLSDDLDLTVGRRRGRRISSSSVMTTRTSRSEDREEVHNPQTSEDVQPRRRTTSKVSFMDPMAGLSNPPGGRRLSQTYGSPPSVRPHRTRTTSTSSYRSLGTNSAVISEDYAAIVPPPQASRLLPDNSQKSLEKVIMSRLVETFITITVPPSFYDSCVENDRFATSNPPGSRPVSPGLNSSAKDLVSVSRHRATSSTSSGISHRLGQPSTSRLSMTSTSPPSSPIQSQSTLKSTHARTKSAVISSRVYNKASLRSPTSAQTFPSPATSAASNPIPDYISPIHTPSTNPHFSLDPTSGREFPAWTDLNAQEMRVELWGRVGGDWGNEKQVSGKGKGKAVDEDSSAANMPRWQVLEKWDVKFSELRRFTDDLAPHPLHLSFNTLSVTLGPYGHTYYVPSHSLGKASSQPSSPVTGHSSDPEQSAITTSESAGDIIVPVSTSGLERARSRAFDSRTQRNDSLLARFKRHPESAKTANWQDLVKFVTLQTCILDTKQSLSQVVRDVDLLVTDWLSDLKREVSERQAWLNQLQSERDEVYRASDDLMSRVRTRREGLRQRREMLRQAREELQLDVFAEHETEEELEDMREQLSSLRSNFAPVRTTLIATLAGIFPIELLATTPDLLYAILGVPLPIPTGTTDPAPPLSLPSRKDVNEDTVATALGYAAQVVQLLAAYLGKRLVYPVTCIGSRSLVRDGISTMVGPRMFPLYSKGVDTYRFEYGVYLLNKDIEMLMTERDLRATDTRYTLPNLNNLLLTLSVGNGAQLPSRSATDSLPPSRAASPAPSDDLSLSSEESLPTSNTTPPVSGSTTPTAASAAEVTTFSKMSRPFFSLSPFGLLRSSSSDRPPSKSSKSVTNGEPPAEAEGNGDATRSSRPEQNVDDEEDRRTIRAVSLHDDETKVCMNGSFGNGTMPRAEKADGGGPEISTLTSNIATPIV